MSTSEHKKHNTIFKFISVFDISFWFSFTIHGTFLHIVLSHLYDGYSILLVNISAGIANYEPLSHLYQKYRGLFHNFWSSILESSLLGTQHDG